MATKVSLDYGQTIFNLAWFVAQEEGLFAKEGLEVEFVRARDRDTSLPPEVDPTKVHPFWRHAPFEEGEAQVFEACEWGQVSRSHASTIGGRIIMLRSAMVSQAILVRPDSPLAHPAGLRNKSVAVNFHASSHYVTLQLLEGFMERDEIKVLHFGQARARYEAMMRGAADAATLSEPYIALAEKQGCHLVAEAFFPGAEIVAPDMDDETLEAANRAIVKAVDLINEDKRKYVHHLVEDLPKDLGPLEEEDFQLWRMRYIHPKPYPPEQFERTRAWMLSWGLIPEDACFESIVDNRIGVIR